MLNAEVISCAYGSLWKPQCIAYTREAQADLFRACTLFWFVSSFFYVRVLQLQLATTRNGDFGKHHDVVEIRLRCFQNGGD